MRGGDIVVLATRFPLRLRREGGWRDTRIELHGEWSDVFTGHSYSGTTEIATLMSVNPVALLERR